MNQGMYPLAATMINQLNRVDVLSNNLANSRTIGFKQDNLSEGSFNNYLKKAQDKNQEVSKLNTVINTIPKIDNKFISQAVGSITPTNNQLDFAIKIKNGFFKVQNPKTKEIVLTRDGAFNTLNNKLVTKNGWDVLDIDNAPITTQGEFAKQIAVVQTDFNNLTKQGNNNYRINNKLVVKPLVGNEEYVLQGALERSNVNTIVTMVQLIESQRKLEQAQKAMTGIDDINQKVINKIGNSR